MITARKGRTRLVAAVGVLGGVLSLTALGGTSNAATSGNNAGNHPKPQAWADRAATQEASDARIRITPKEGAYDVGINDSVKVTVSNGRLTNVTMIAVATGAEVPGTLSADGTSWKPNSHLERSTKYQVAAEAKDAKGRSATGNAADHHGLPANNFIGHLSEDGSTVGVAVPRSSSVRQGDQQQGRHGVEDPGQLQQRPAGRRPLVQRRPPGLPSQPLLEARLHRHRHAESPRHPEDGHVDRPEPDQHGRRQDEADDRRTGRQDDQDHPDLVQQHQRHPTYNGQMVISEKFRQIHMNGATVGLTEKGGKPSYDIEAVPHAMRLTASGAFIHGNYWGADAVFGKVNTSHGCVGPEGRQGRRRWQAARRVVLRQLDDR